MIGSIHALEWLGSSGNVAAGFDGLEGFMDLEAEYNNRARVPEHLDIIAGWQSDAAAYRDAAQCELDLAYGATERTKLDLFHADGEDPPMAMFIHGGYWQAMDRKVFSHMAHGLNAHGISVAMPSYDLCPAVTIGDIVEQMRQCCAWLWSQYRKPLTVFGHSAGGHLTAAMMATDWPARDGALPASFVPAGYAISGVFDLVPLIETSLNAALGLDEETAHSLSPLYWQPPADSHIVAAVGALESGEFLRQSQTVCDAWSAHGVLTTYREIENTNHFTVISGLADAASPMVHDIVELTQSSARS
ncbi:MAG: alpha/beta hydrolase [Hyphomicrobiales bacterium]